MKKVAATLLSILILAVFIRIAYVNINAERPVIQVYEMNTEVFYEDNYFEYADENRDGYSITVLSAKILKTEDFLKEQNIKELNIPTGDEYSDWEKYIPEYVYDVTVHIKNTNCKENGIDMFNTVLATDTAVLKVDEHIWDALYPHLGGSLKFALVENSEETIHLPFAISYSDACERKAVDNDMLFNCEFQLTISKYPSDIRINIKPSL